MNAQLIEMTLQYQLNKLNACEEAQEWAKDFTTLKEAWEACHRGDWMIWIYARLRPNNLRELTLAKGYCANTVRHLMKDEISIRAVDSLVAFGDGRAPGEDFAAAADAAADAAYAADTADAYAADAAAYTAADAAVDAAYTAAAYAADAAAYAAYAAADTAADAAYDAAAASAASDARKENQQLTADICRKYLTQTMFA